MAREQGSGGRKGRSTGSRGKSGDAGKKSGWVKPDGTPLRKRKGDYFPDKEINKRKPAQRSKSSYTRTSSDTPRPEKGTYQEQPARDDSKPDYKSRPERSDRPERSTRDDSRSPYKSRTDRPERPGRDDSSAPFKSRSERSDRNERTERSDKPERSGRPGRAGRDAARSEYRGRPDIAPRGDRTERPTKNNDRPERSSGTDRPSRESRTDKPIREGSYAAYKSRSTRDDRPERSSGNDARSESASRPARDDSSPAYKKKPFEKKREKYSERDHSKEMRGRFDKRTGDKEPKRRESYKKKLAGGGSEPDSQPGAVRLNKYIANAGICSRREADDLITAGVIAVNGQVVTELGTKVNPGDEVKFNDQTLKTETMVYVLLNKPKDYITTTDDPEERKTVMNLVHDAGKERIFPVGRLDRNTTGLLLLTNDGELTKRLTHPSGNVKKIYQVELDSNLTQDDMVRAAEGVELEDGVASVDEIHYESPTEKNIIGVELHSGRNRVVRRIFEAMDYKVRKLDRVYFAGLTKKDLPRGRWRYLTEMEVNMLKMLTGKKGGQR